MGRCFVRTPALHSLPLATTVGQRSLRHLRPSCLRLRPAAQHAVSKRQPAGRERRWLGRAGGIEGHHRALPMPGIGEPGTQLAVARPVAARKPLGRHAIDLEAVGRGQHGDPGQRWCRLLRLPPGGRHPPNPHRVSHRALLVARHPIAALDHWGRSRRAHCRSAPAPLCAARAASAATLRGKHGQIRAWHGPRPRLIRVV